VTKWTEQAIRQLQQVHDYIASSGSEKVATDVATRIISTVEQLDLFPLSGRAGCIPNNRELVISGTPFIAAYTINQRDVTVLAVYHGAQKWPEKLG
jgi:plasmid stabilization system protein ParE